METAKQALGRKMRAARMKRGLRQEDVAEALSVDKKQVGRWERGENTPGGLRLTNFVEFLRKKSDAADLDALENSIDPTLIEAAKQGLIDATADSPIDPNRQRAMDIIDHLSRRPRALERWLTLGEGMALGTDDTA
jgi:transcriptional regulator with XRE-family HTH domain